jgi:hypothetical protein
LHASREPFDALNYAPGDTLCLVDCAGDRFEKADKLVCQRRRIVARMDAAEMLCYFARMQALAVVHLWEPDDVVLDWLMTGDENLRASAYASAYDSARDSASASPYDSAYDSASASASASAIIDLGRNESNIARPYHGAARRGSGADAVRRSCQSASAVSGWPRKSFPTWS